MPKYLNLRNYIAQGLVFAFLLNSLGPIPAVQAQDLALPVPGTMVSLSPAFNPPILKGLKVHPDNPFRFDFILDKGDSQLSNDLLKDESSKLIKYFLASLTIPEKDLWVNLSPYEKNRIVSESFGQTEMGRDLLAEDYMLKQITASLIYPESKTGKEFWNRVYEEAARRFGTTNILVNTFNKVWIVPEKAVVYENAKAGTAYVVESKLKVMLEQDYLSLQKHEGISAPPQVKDTNQLGSQIVREIVIPELTKEVNEGQNFTQLRQVYNSLILATWYKKKIKENILAQVYENQNKISGVNINDPQEKERIYERYLEAFKKGAYNYIKEEIDPVSQQSVPRKYFSGGIKWDMAMINIDPMPEKFNPAQKDDLQVTVNLDAAMNSDRNRRTRSEVQTNRAALKRLLDQFPYTPAELAGRTGQNQVSVVADIKSLPELSNHPLLVMKRDDDRTAEQRQKDQVEIKQLLDEDFYTPSELALKTKINIVLIRKDIDEIEELKNHPHLEADYDQRTEKEKRRDRKELKEMLSFRTYPWYTVSSLAERLQMDRELVRNDLQVLGLANHRGLYEPADLRPQTEMWKDQGKLSTLLAKAPRTIEALVRRTGIPENDIRKEIQQAVYLSAHANLRDKRPPRTNVQKRKDQAEEKRLLDQGPHTIQELSKVSGIDPDYVRLDLIETRLWDHPNHRRGRRPNRPAEALPSHQAAILGILNQGPNTIPGLAKATGENQAFTRWAVKLSSQLSSHPNLRKHPHTAIRRTPPEIEAEKRQLKEILDRGPVSPEGLASQSRISRDRVDNYLATVPYLRDHRNLLIDRKGSTRSAEQILASRRGLKFLLDQGPQTELDLIRKIGGNAAIIRYDLYSDPQLINHPNLIRFRTRLTDIGVEQNREMLNEFLDSGEPRVQDIKEYKKEIEILIRKRHFINRLSFLKAILGLKDEDGEFIFTVAQALSRTIYFTMENQEKILKDMDWLLQLQTQDNQRLLNAADFKYVTARYGLFQKPIFEKLLAIFDETGTGKGQALYWALYTEKYKQLLREWLSVGFDDLSDESKKLIYSLVSGTRFDQIYWEALIRALFRGRESTMMLALLSDKEKRAEGIWTDISKRDLLEQDDTVVKQLLISPQLDIRSGIQAKIYHYLENNIVRLTNRSTGRNKDDILETVHFIINRYAWMRSGASLERLNRNISYSARYASSYLYFKNLPDHVRRLILAIKRLEQRGRSTEEIEDILSKRYTPYQIAEAKGFGLSSLDAPLNEEGGFSLYDVISEQSSDSGTLDDEDLDDETEEPAYSVEVNILGRQTNIQAETVAGVLRTFWKNNKDMGDQTAAILRAIQQDRCEVRINGNLVNLIEVLDESLEGINAVSITIESDAAMRSEEAILRNIAEIDKTLYGTGMSEIDAETAAKWIARRRELEMELEQVRAFKKSASNPATVRKISPDGQYTAEMAAAEFSRHTIVVKKGDEIIFDDVDFFHDDFEFTPDSKRLVIRVDIFEDVSEGLVEEFLDLENPRAGLQPIPSDAAMRTTITLNGGRYKITDAEEVIKFLRQVVSSAKKQLERLADNHTETFAFRLKEDIRNTGRTWPAVLAEIPEHLITMTRSGAYRMRYDRIADLERWLTGPENSVVKAIQISQTPPPKPVKSQRQEIAPLLGQKESTSPIWSFDIMFKDDIVVTMGSGVPARFYYQEANGDVVAITGHYKYTSVSRVEANLTRNMTAGGFFINQELFPRFLGLEPISEDEITDTKTVLAQGLGPLSTDSLKYKHFTSGQRMRIIYKTRDDKIEAASGTFVSKETSDRFGDEHLRFIFNKDGDQHPTSFDTFDNWSRPNGGLPRIFAYEVLTAKETKEVSSPAAGMANPLVGAEEKKGTDKARQYIELWIWTLIYLEMTTMKERKAWLARFLGFTPENNEFRKVFQRLDMNRRNGRDRIEKTISDIIDLVPDLDAVLNRQVRIGNQIFPKEFAYEVLQELLRGIQYKRSTGVYVDEKYRDIIAAMNTEGRNEVLEGYRFNLYIKPDVYDGKIFIQTTGKYDGLSDIVGLQYFRLKLFSGELDAAMNTIVPNGRDSFRFHSFLNVNGYFINDIVKVSAPGQEDVWGIFIEDDFIKRPNGILRGIALKRPDGQREVYTTSDDVNTIVYVFRDYKDALANGAPSDWKDVQDRAMNSRKSVWRRMLERIVTQAGQSMSGKGVTRRTFMTWTGIGASNFLISGRILSRLVPSSRPFAPAVTSLFSSMNDLLLEYVVDNRIVSNFIGRYIEGYYDNDNRFWFFYSAPCFLATALEEVPYLSHVPSMEELKQLEKFFSLDASSERLKEFISQPVVKARLLEEAGLEFKDKPDISEEEKNRIYKEFADEYFYSFHELIRDLIYLRENKDKLLQGIRSDRYSPFKGNEVAALFEKYLDGGLPSVIKDRVFDRFMSEYYHPYLDSMNAKEMEAFSKAWEPPKQSVSEQPQETGEEKGRTADIKEARRLNVVEAREELLRNTEAFYQRLNDFVPLLEQAHQSLESDHAEDFSSKWLPQLEQEETGLTQSARDITGLPSRIGFAEESLKKPLDDFMGQVREQYHADKVAILLPGTISYMHSLGMTEEELGALYRNVNNRRLPEIMAGIGVNALIRVNNPVVRSLEKKYGLKEDPYIFVYVMRSGEIFSEFGTFSQEESDRLQEKVGELLEQERAPWVGARSQLKRLGYTDLLWMIAALRHDTQLGLWDDYIAWLFGELKILQEPDKLKQTTEILHNQLSKDIPVIESFINILKLGRHFESTNVAPIIKEQVELFRQRIEDKGLKLSVDIESNDLTAKAIDVNYLKLVINNLFENAIKYTDKGEIKVRLFRGMETSADWHPDIKKEAILLEVEDTGIGVPKDEQSKIFHPLTRASNVGERPGTGWGLNFVYDALRYMHGMIYVTSEEGKGSKFLVTLDPDQAMKAHDGSPRRLTVEMATERFKTDLKSLIKFYGPFSVLLKEAAENLKAESVEDFKALRLPKIERAARQIHRVEEDLQNLAVLFGFGEEDVQNMAEEFIKKISDDFKVDKVIVEFGGMNGAVYSIGFSEKELKLYNQATHDLYMLFTYGPQTEGGQKARRALRGMGVKSFLELRALGSGIFLGRSPSLTEQEGALKAEDIPFIQEKLTNDSEFGEKFVSEVMQKLRERGYMDFGYFMGMFRHNSMVEMPASIEASLKDVNNPQGPLGRSKEGVIGYLNDLVETIERATPETESFIELLERGAHYQVMDIEPLIREKVESYRRVIERKGLKLEMDFDDGQFRARSIEPNYLNLVVENLIENAIKYTDKGTIKVHLYRGSSDMGYGRPEKGILFKIEDTGIGIPEKDIPEIFGFGVRASNVGRRPGTGKGLNIVVHALHSMRGDVDVSSKVGEGTAFTIIFRPADNAQLVISKKLGPGGIDLTSDKALTVQNNGQAIKFHIDPAQLVQLQNAPGFTPVIISIQPCLNLRKFLGLTQETSL